VTTVNVDAAVIGAGAIGTATAFHLASRGLKTALLDQAEPGSQSSPRAAGLAVQVRTNYHFSEIARRSVDAIVAFQDATGVPLAYRQAGSVAIGRTDAAAARAREHVELGARNGVSVELITPDDVRELAPYADASSGKAISYTPTDLYLEPEELVRAYLKACENLGVIVMPYRKAEAVVAAGGAVSGVSTRQETISAERVVVCAGPWTASVLESVGLELPVQAVRHALVITRPIDSVVSGQAAVRVIDANVYARPCRGGLMIGGYESQPLFVEASEYSAVEALPLDATVIHELMARVELELPLARHTEIAVLRGGLPTLTPDGLFLIDSAPELEGLYFATGCNVGGLSTAPAVAEDIATWVSGGVKPPDLTPFSLRRFAADGDPDALRERSRSSYTATEFG
jgi:glycine/D-amino acid oxidase-like deaminating enzyme